MTLVIIVVHKLKQLYNYLNIILMIMHYEMVNKISKYSLIKNYNNYKYLIIFLNLSLL